MKKILLLAFVLGGLFAKGQDYLIDERFEPSLFKPHKAYMSDRHRMVYGWGLNTSSLDETKTINEWGSNVFNIGYQYNQPVYKGLKWDIGLNYNFDNFKLKQREDVLFHDSIFHDKTKFRMQNIGIYTGIRLESSKSVKSVKFQLNGYFNFNVSTKHTTWDEVGELKLKNETRKLEYITPYSYGVEAKLALGNLGVFARYRLSEIIKNDSGYNDLPAFAFGLQIDVRK